MRKRQYRKRPQVEQTIGMTIPEYIQCASVRGLTQGKMAEELGIQRITLGKWLEDEDFEQVPTYVKRQEAAA